MANGSLSALPIWSTNAFNGYRSCPGGKRKLIWSTPVTNPGAAPAYNTSRDSCHSTATGRLSAPPPVAQTLTMDPGAAGLVAEFNDPSWLSAAAGLAFAPN